MLKDFVLVSRRIRGPISRRRPGPLDQRLTLGDVGGYGQSGCPMGVRLEDHNARPRGDHTIILDGTAFGLVSEPLPPQT